MKLTNKITALILLVLSLAMLSSCVQRAPGSQAQTTEGNSDTETSLEDLEFKLEMPSEELQERFVNEYIAYRNYDPENHPIVAIESWYGSFGDIHFLLVHDSELSYTQAHRTEVIADSSFNYPDGQSILVWVDGQFMYMEKAYEQNLITKDMVATIADVYNGTIGIAEPTDELLRQIEKDYSSFLTETSKYDPAVDGSFYVKNYYGIYNNCIPVMFFMPETGAYRDEEVAGRVFHYSGSQSIHVWCQGDFFTLSEAYEQGLLSHRQITRIAVIHNTHQYLEYQLP